VKQKKPYRLSARLLLSPEPPFTVEIVHDMLRAALIGPKGRATNKHAEPNADAVSFLTGTLNHRHAFFYGAQQDRARAERRDRALKVLADLRSLMGQVATDAEQQRQRAKVNDIFSQNHERAAKATSAFLHSDLFATALPPVQLPESVRGWQWCAPSLHADVAAMIGANAAARFLFAAIPKLTGESPKLASVQIWLKQQAKNSG
jgi:hypothetical protein